MTDAIETCVIRPATAADGEAICELILALFSDLYPGLYSAVQVQPVIERILRGSTTVFPFLAVMEGRPVGLIVLNQCTAIYALGDFGEISELFVAPAMRSSGLGAKLIEQAVVVARSKGWTVLEVGAPDVPRWQRTVDFYRRNGFAEVGPRLYRSFVNV